MCIACTTAKFPIIKFNYCIYTLHGEKSSTEIYFDCDALQKVQNI